MISNVSAQVRSCEAGTHTQRGPLHRISPRLSTWTYGLGTRAWTVNDVVASSIYMASGAETPSSPSAAARVFWDATHSASRKARRSASGSLRTGESR